MADRSSSGSAAEHQLHAFGRVPPPVARLGQAGGTILRRQFSAVRTLFDQENGTLRPCQLPMLRSFQG